MTIMATYSLAEKGWVLRDVEKGERFSNNVFKSAGDAEGTLTPEQRNGPAKPKPTYTPKPKPTQDVGSQAEAKPQTATSSSNREKGGQKAETVAAVIKQYPHMSAGQIAKKVAEQHPISYANAYYLASKALKKG